MAQKLKNLSAIWETQVWSLGREDPLEEGMATHSSTLAWRIPWTEEPRKLQSMRSQRIGHDKRKINTYILHTTFLVEKFREYHFCIKKKYPVVPYSQWFLFRLFTGARSHLQFPLLTFPLLLQNSSSELYHILRHCWETKLPADITAFQFQALSLKYSSTT